MCRFLGRAALGIVCWLAVRGIAGAQAVPPPVPSWPADNRIPANLNGNYVYWDSGAWGAVVVLTGALQGRPGEPARVIRLPFKNRFDIELAAAVVPVGGGYQYTYSVQNGRGAKDPVTGWWIATSCADAQLTVAQQGSHCIRAGMPAARQVLLPHIKALGCYASCFSDAPVAPGTQAPQITISSADLPGMITFSAANYPPFDVPRDWPDVILEQLSLLGSPTWSNRHVATVGPRFSPETPLRTIAADFRDSLKDLTSAGTLSPDSPFATEAQALFDRIARSGQSVPSKIAAAPATELEREILQAATLSLGLAAAAK